MTEPETNDTDPGQEQDQEPKPKRRRLVYTDADMALAEEMQVRIQDIIPGFKAKTITTWANDIRLMREQDGYTLDEIRTVFAWANQDEFWSANILSTLKLRKHFVRLQVQRKRYLDNLKRGARSAVDQVRAARKQRGGDADD